MLNRRRLMPFLSFGAAAAGLITIAGALGVVSEMWIGAPFVLPLLLIGVALIYVATELSE